MRTRENGRTPRFGSHPTHVASTAKLVAAALAALVTTVGASGTLAIAPPLPGTATFVDWDLPLLGGSCPSALGAVTMRPIDSQQPVDPVYYVTLCPDVNSSGRFGPSLVELRTEMHPQPAAWRAWNLGDSPAPTVTDPLLLEPAAVTGGVRLSNSSRAYVRTQSELLRLNFTTSPVTITRWRDVLLDQDPAAQSDLAVVDRWGATDVWSSHNTKTLVPGPLTTQLLAPVLNATTPPGMLQRLTVSNTSNTATVTRYAVDGGAGLHYLSGVVSFQGKIYYSEGYPATDPVTGRGNSIGVLDPATGDVHRFSLSALDLTGSGAVSGPRQLSVDPSTGTIWTVTQSGHVVSLKPGSSCGNGLPNSAYMASYRIPGGLTDPRGVAPSGGTVGFTQSAFDPVDGKKVGLLVPNKPQTKVDARTETVAKQTFCLNGTNETVVPDTGAVQGVEKPNNPTIPTDLDGRFTQAQLPDTGDFPLGILRDPFSCDKAFYFAVALGGVGNGGNHRLSRVVFDTAPIQPPVPPSDDTKPGLVTGGGTLGTDPSAPDYGDTMHDPDDWAPGGGKANFGFVVDRKNTGDVPKGHLTYQNKLTGDNVKSVTITHFSIAGNTASFGGTCTNSNLPLLPCTFEVTVQDNGTPGKDRDTFSISGLGFTANQGTLTGGNIYIHKR